MRRGMGVLNCLLVAVLALSSPLAYSADRSADVTTQADLDTAVAKKLAQEDAARATIRGLLQRDVVREMAKSYDLDLKRADAAVGTLQGDELESLSLQAAQVDSQLSGGDTVISLSLVSLLLIIIIIILLTR
jgi:cell division protein FtsL